MLFLASCSNKYKYRPLSKIAVKWHDLGWPRKRPKLNFQHLRKISNSEIGYYFNYHQVLLHKFIYFPEKTESVLKKRGMFFNFFVFSAGIFYPTYYWGFIHDSSWEDSVNHTFIKPFIVQPIIPRSKSTFIPFE